MRNSKILSKIDFWIILDLVLIALALCWINYGNFDIEVQNYLFDFESKSWLVDKNEPVKKFIFYKLPKILFGVGVTGCLLGVILGFRDSKQILKQVQDDNALALRYSNSQLSPLRHPELVSGSIPKSNFLIRHRHRLLLIFFGFSFIPLIAGNIKKFTNVYCPTQLEIYGGDKPYIRIFEHYPSSFHQAKKAQCFPAGHSVTGFTLMILFFALRRRSQRCLGLISAIILGWIMGLYQMAKGAHFFGDTLVSMLVCFLLAALITRIYLKFQKYD